MRSEKVERRAQCCAQEKHSQTKKKERGLGRVGASPPAQPAKDCQVSRVNQLRIGMG